MVIMLKALALFETTLTLIWLLIDEIYSHYENEYDECFHSYQGISKFQHRKALKISEKCCNIANIIYAVNVGLLMLGGIVYLYYIIINA